jgi:hypothetical protein
LNGKISPHDLILKAASNEKIEVCLSPIKPESDLPIDLAEHQLFFQAETLKQQLKEAQDTHKLRLGYVGRIF